ncbi:cystatin-F isoform X1 [Ursus americanus]|uniref:cystatin-F isoform X1 n=1 Tax=Ursus americanus TaxID=9643 RepID=UPI001E67BD12|nr:cystatin-F isoform X1 [Ursus americanus]
MALCGIRSPRPEPVLGLVPRTAWQEVAREGQRGLRCCPELAPPDGPTQSLEAGWILTITEGEDSRSALTNICSQTLSPDVKPGFPKTINPHDPEVLQAARHSVERFNNCTNDIFLFKESHISRALVQNPDPGQEADAAATDSPGAPRAQQEGPEPPLVKAGSSWVEPSGRDPRHIWSGAQEGRGATGHCSWAR